MSSAIRVVILGIGSVGSGIVQTLQNRKGIEIVGAIDIAPEKLGKDVGILTGGSEIGVIVRDDLEAFCADTKADVIINTASPANIQDTYKQLLPAIQHGMNAIVASAETCNLEFTDKEIAEEIDKLCKDNGVSYIGRGATQSRRTFYHFYDRRKHRC